MKLIITLSILVASSSLFAETRVIKNVSICAASCQSEVLGHINHDMAQTGEIYIAKFSSDTATNSNVCMSEAGNKTIALAGDRGTTEEPVGIDAETCSSILKGDYFGKNVTVETEEIDGNRYALKIFETKK
ncbi:MAG: hypothetical protein H7177_00130 [Rhizobacter sp.]|nr:hypothetical protein [Bacteriovorax sp.]